MESATAETHRWTECLMPLTKVDREKITDSVLKIQSARASLEDVDATKVPEIESIQSCLETADKNLRRALRD